MRFRSSMFLFLSAILFMPLSVLADFGVSDKQLKDYIDQHEGINVQTKIELSLIKFWDETRYIGYAANLFDNKNLENTDLEKVKNIIRNQLYSINGFSLVHDDFVVAHLANLLQLFYYTSRDYFEGKIEYSSYIRIYKFVRTYSLDFVYKIEQNYRK